MEKLFYRINFRMGRNIQESSINKILVEYFYYSTGYCMIEGNEIKGIMTNDSFIADINDESFLLTMFYNEIEVFENFTISEKEYMYHAIGKILGEFELPCRIFLITKRNSSETLCFDLNFISEIEDIEEQIKVEEQLEKIGLI